MSGFHPGQLSFLLWAASDTLPTPVNLRRWQFQSYFCMHNFSFFLFSLFLVLLVFVVRYFTRTLLAVPTQIFHLVICLWSHKTDNLLCFVFINDNDGFSLSNKAFIFNEFITHIARNVSTWEAF